MAQIYKISHKTDESLLPYFGSTSKSILNRLGNHKYGKQDTTISKQVNCNGGWSNYKIDIIEVCPDDQRLEREQYYINNNSCCNRNNPLRKCPTPAEYRKSIGSIKCECGGSYRYGDKKKHFITNKHRNFTLSNIPH